MGDARAVDGRDLGEIFGGLGAWAATFHVPAARRAYGLSPDQFLDLRVPAGDGPHPVAVVLHGGFWRAAFTHENTVAIAIALTRAGFATVNVEYRRVGSGGGFPQTLDDVATACRLVAVVDAPLDLATIVAVGHSAGGQLALWLAAEHLVHGAVALAGVCDLAAAATAGLGGGAVERFFGGTPEQVPHAYARADPARRLPTGARQLLVHGDRDDRVPLAQSIDYCAAARAAGDECQLLVLEGADHFDVIDPRTSHWAQILEAMRELSGR